jgi:hypothetical protein
MRKSSGPITPMATAGILIILIAAAWALSREPAPLQVQRLPGGTIELEAVTYGQEHRLVQGSYWQRLLAPLLPPGLQIRLLGTVHAWRGSGPGEMVFWTTWRPPPGYRAHFGTAVVFDEHGCQFGTVHYLEPPEKDGHVTFRVARVTPRRGAWIGLRLRPWRASTGEAPLAEFRAANPAPGPYPTWTPEPLPVTKRAGDLTVTLTRLLTGLKHGGPDVVPDPEWTCANFRIAQHGRPTKEWAPIEIPLSDATGNVNVPESGNQYEHAGELHLAFQDGLCSNESAWKLRVECSRTAGFAPPDQWTVRGVAVPKPGAVAHSTSSATRHGVELRLIGIAGIGASFPDGGPTDWDPPSVHVRARSPLDGKHLMLVRATDDRGREVSTFSSGSTDRDRYSSGLKIPAGASSLDLTFAVHPSRFVEFLARPVPFQSKPLRSGLATALRRVRGSE